MTYRCLVTRGRAFDAINGELQYIDDASINSSSSPRGTSVTSMTPTLTGVTRSQWKILRKRGMPSPLVPRPILSTSERLARSTRVGRRPRPLETFHRSAAQALASRVNGPRARDRARGRQRCAVTRRNELRLARFAADLDHRAQSRASPPEHDPRDQCRDSGGGIYRRRRRCGVPPAFWPETVRALLVHSAEGTPQMRAQFGAVGDSRRQRAALLCVATDSVSHAVTVSYGARPTH